MLILDSNMIGSQTSPCEANLRQLFGGVAVAGPKRHYRYPHGDGIHNLYSERGRFHQANNEMDSSKGGA